MTTDRTPYCHKIRYGITGAPILTEDDMDGSYAPGIGVSPTLIELIYSAARDGKPASVSASVTGTWTRFGERADGQVATHFKGDPDGWPAWLAEEARLHDPAAVPVPPPADQTALRDRLADALYRHEWPGKQVWVQALAMDRETFEAMADAVLAVLPEQTDRAALLRQEADQIRAHCPDHLDSDSAPGAWMVCHCDVADDMLRRVAAEDQPAACGRPASIPSPCSAGDHCCEGPSTETESGCAHCGGPHAWDDCEAYTALVAAEEQPAETQDALVQARATNQRLNLRAQALESELAAHRRAVRQWEVSERGTYIPHSSLRAIGKACGVDVLGTVRHLKHFERVEQAEAAIEGVRALHRKASHGRTCVYCAHGQRLGYDTDWPCDTIRALDDAARPAVGEQPETQEALRCVCGDPIQLMDEADPTSWIHSPGSDTRCLDARPRCPHCQMPHDLTPGMSLACASIRASIRDRDAAEAPE
ncbi:hypothetical protein [Streptomyces galilaeus]|uniref:hypothetical protein n=1 Tax=Streptomyces galilaeus TaxID=33899 RepID=UPI0038F6E3D9